jgi:hypothetical protein
MGRGLRVAKPAAHLMRRTSEDRFQTRPAQPQRRARRGRSRRRFTSWAFSILVSLAVPVSLRLFRSRGTGPCKYPSDRGWHSPGPACIQVVLRSESLVPTLSWAGYRCIRGRTGSVRVFVHFADFLENASTSAAALVGLPGFSRKPRSLNQSK